MKDEMKLGDANTMNAPWSLTTRLRTAHLAAKFFLPGSREAVGHASTGRLSSVRMFVDYLNKIRVYGSRRPNVFRIIELLHKMERSGILLNLGPEGERRALSTTAF